MKLQQQDKVKTSCKECVLAQYNSEGKTQTGCKANRISGFMNNGVVIEAYDDDKEFYVINTLCSYHRPSSWKCDGSPIEKIKHESAPTFDIFIDCNNMDTTYFNKVVKLMKSISYYQDKFRIYLCNDVLCSEESRKNILSAFCTLEDTRLRYVTECLSLDEHYHLTVRNAETTFHICVNNDNINHFIDHPTILREIDGLINEQISWGLVYNFNDSIRAISNAAYGMVSYELSNNQYYDVIQDLISKLKEYHTINFGHSGHDNFYDTRE
jgi:hypothetical protein